MTHNPNNKQPRISEGLSFSHDGGRIEFLYSEQSYQTRGIVPAEIVRQGEEAILEYAQREVDRQKASIREGEAAEDEIRKNPIPIRATYQDGTPLEGRIIEATSRYIGVELDKPLQGSSHINFGFASAMAGHHVFNADHQISEAGLKGARTALAWAYEKALHKPEEDLVARLNEGLKRR